MSRQAARPLRGRLFPTASVGCSAFPGHCASHGRLDATLQI